MFPFRRGAGENGFGHMSSAYQLPGVRVVTQTLYFERRANLSEFNAKARPKGRVLTLPPERGRSPPALEFGHFCLLAERDNDANSWFGGRNAAVPIGDYQPPEQPEGLPDISRGLSGSDTPGTPSKPKRTLEGCQNWSLLEWHICDHGSRHHPWMDSDSVPQSER